MEHNEAYKKVLLKTLELEKQVSLCDDALKECGQSVVEAKKKIEEHFAQCVNALVARKDSLLNELADKAAFQKESIEEAKSKAKAYVDTSKSIAQSALLMFSISPVSAEDFCKSIDNIPTLLGVNTKIGIDLSTRIFDYIRLHGTILSPINTNNTAQFSKPVTASILPSVPNNNATRFSVASMVTTLAGCGQWGKVDGKGEIASFNRPFGMCFNPLDDCLYVCDCENRSIRKVSIQGDVSTFATEVADPLGIAINIKDKAFFVTCEDTIARISLQGGKTTLFAGNGTKGYTDGVGPKATFNILRGIVTDQQTGHMFVCDARNNMIRRLLPQGWVSTLAGHLEKGYVDGKKEAKFAWPTGICFDNDSLLVCDYQNNKLRRLQCNGDVSTLCEIPTPLAVTITANKIILISSSNNKIYKVIQKGQSFKVSVLAGTGATSSIDGKPNESSFNHPYSIVVHEPSHSCFVVDHASYTIRKISFK